MKPLLKPARPGPADHRSVFAEFSACLMVLIGQPGAPVADKTHRAPRFRVVR